jgi:hypothetical protein
MTKNIFAIFGVVTFVFMLLGAFGIGNFVYSYTDKPFICKLKETNK